MSFNDEYLALRKKRKQEQEAELRKNPVTAPLFVNKTAPLYNNDDIAPSFVPYPSEKKEAKEERTVFQSGALEDGVSWKNVGKTILGTVADAAEDIGTGLLGMGERIVDAGAFVAGGVGGLLGADEFQSDMEAFVKKDLYDENEVAKKILSGLSSAAYTSGITWAGGSLGKSELETAQQMREESREYIDLEMEDDSVLAERADAFAQSVGNYLGQAVATSAGIPWWLTVGVTSFGGKVEGALNDGATGAEAAVSGLISAGGEILGEKFFGGMLGEVGFDDAMAKHFSRTISNKFWRNFATVSGKSFGEGLEEEFSLAVERFGDWLTYKKKRGESLKDMFLSEEAVDEAIETFFGGALLGGGKSTVDAVVSGKKGVDYASGLTANEEKVVTKEYESRVSEKEADGTKLTEKEKTEIYDAVVSDMEKGRISIDTIEEVLGGDTYKAYKETVAREDALSERFAFIGNKTNATLAEQSEYAELKAKVDEMKKTSQRSELKSKLGEEVFGLVKGDRLVESYNERGRRSQAFEADLTKYDAKSQATIKKAVESGILNNTRRTHEFVDMIAKISADKGVLFDFTNNEKLKGSVFAVDGKAVNGYVTKDGVTLNIDSAKSLNSVVGHEITHVLEGTELYTALQSAVTEYAKTKGDYQGRYDSLSKLYEGVKDANVDAELTADLVGDYLFTDTDFINNLATNKNVFQKIYDEIKYLCKVATAGSKEARELERVKRAFEKAYQESGKSNSYADESAVQKKTRVGGEYGVIENLLNMGRVNNTFANEIIRDAELSKAFTDITGVTLEGTTEQKRNQIRNTVREYQVRSAENEELAKTAAEQAQTEQAIRDGGYTSYIRGIFAKGANVADAKEILRNPDMKAEWESITGKTLPTNEKSAIKMIVQTKRNPANIGLPDVDAKYSLNDADGNGARFNGKPFWSGSVSLIDGVIEEVHSYKEAEDADFHHSMYFSQPQVEKMANGENGFFFVDGGKVYGEWRDTIPKDILNKIEGQIVKYSLSDSDSKPIDSARISADEFDTKYSLSHSGEIAKGQTDYIGKHKAYVTDEELAEAQRVTAAMVDVMMKYSNILPEDKIGKVLTKNGSYDRSVENTTICVRTLAYNEFVDKVQEELGRPLTQMESFLVSQKLYDIATEPQCLYCYVSLDRKAFNDMLLRYMTDRDTVIAKYNNSDKSPAAIEALYEEFLHGRKPTKEMRTRFDAWLGYVDDGVQLLSLADIATEDRQGVIKANGGILAEQLKDARKYAQSASWSKIQKNYVAYRDEILKLGDRVVKNLNEHYGLRWYSFSDYSAAFIVENMQQITDASIRGLKGLAYTKDTDFAEIFAPSGMNINISVFVNTDKDGNFFIDEKQSAKFEQAKALRERYPNVGIVATVTNDDALRWAASQEWSDVIIPFHIVRTGTDVAEYYKWLNYTSESADTIADKDMWNAYVDSLNLKSEGARKKVSKNIYPNEHKNDKNTYLTLCESRGLTPRFVRFAGEDWYMKLVNETRLSADASATLKPIYDEEAAKASFQKFVDKGGYEGGWYHEGVDVDAEARAVADDVLAGKRANEVGYGRQDGFVPEDLIASRKTNRQHGRMSLSEQGEQLFAPIRSSDIFGKDIRLETAVPENVAPVVNAENAKTTPVVAMPDEEEVAPVMDYDAEQFESLTDADAPPPRNRGRLYDIPEEPKMTLEERRAAKLKAVQTELAENRTNRLNAATDYNQEIARLQSRYDAKKNKTTKVAHDLLRRIERVKRIRDSVDADYAKRITDLEAREKLVRDGKPTTRQELHNGIVDDIKTEFKGRGYDFDKVLKGAKNLSTFATVDNTPQRVMEKALGYKEGQILSDITVNKVAQNETEGIKWLNDKIALIKQISKQYGIKPGSKESAAAQMYAEGFYVDENNDIISYGDAELAQDFTDANVRQNIKLLASDPRIRQIYDETLGSINESRTRNAYPEIPRLDNYFLHFRAMEDTFSKIGLPFNPNDIRAKDLPTDLNGVTADLKPGQPYFASAMHRTGKRTSFDLLGGLERYLSSAKNQIYHIDDIQTLRALRNYIADTYGQANGLEGLDTLTEEEAQDRIAKVYGAHLSTFAKFLNEEANILAGKTSLIDRGLEGIIGRRGITFLDTVNKQVGSNMVGFNVSSSLTNFLPVAQTFAKSNKFDFVKAFTQTVANKIGSIYGRTDSFTENSPVVIRRKGADRFYRTPFQKAGDAGYVLMSAVDDISTELIARTKYNELVRKGMDSQKAHYETDKWVSRLMGDRSLGQQPQLYNSRMLGLITKFQLEVRNQLDSQFYDTIQETKVSNEEIQNGLERNARTAAKVASTFAQLAVVQHLFGVAFESVAGYNPAFDIIGVLLTACGFDDDEESEDTVLDNIEQGFLALLEDLPYTSTFTGGRIPISSALPVEELVTGQDEWGNDKSRLETIGEVAPYYLLPGGYGQIKKSAQGLDMFSDDHPIAGSYTDSGNLRFPVDDTIGNRIQAGIFGQYASENARDHFDNERTPLNEKQIQEYSALGVSYDEYWKRRSEMNKIGKRAEEKGASDADILKSKYINSIGSAMSDVLAEKQEVLESTELTVLEKDKIIRGLDEEFARLANERYNSFDDVTISGKYASIGSLQFRWYEPGEDSTAEPEWKKLTADQIKKQDKVTSGLGISPSEYWSNKEEYDFAYEKPEKYAVAKSVGGYEAYTGYSKALNKIKGVDNDGDGRSDTGTRKEKVLDWVNGLDADYGTKIILYKSEYNADDTYNYDIIDYLNSRNDISYAEMVAILKELGFDVSADGTVSW